MILRLALPLGRWLPINCRSSSTLFPQGFTTGAVRQKLLRAASEDPKKTEFITMNSVLVVSALHHKPMFSITGDLFMGVHLKIKKIPMLLPSCSMSVVI